MILEDSEESLEQKQNHFKEMESMVYKNNCKLLICWQSKLQSGGPKRLWNIINPRDHRSKVGWPEKFAVTLWVILSVGFINLLVHIIASDDKFV